MDYWLYLTGEDDQQLIDLARHAEAVGIRGVALADHVAVPVDFESVHPSGKAPFDHRSSFPDPLTSAAAILASTERLEVMTYVYILSMREPFSVAKQAATLSVLSDDRFRLGVGAGWLSEEIALLGHPLHGRGKRMDEMIEIMRAFWTQESVEFHGEFFDFGPTGMAPRPEPRRVARWAGPSTARRYRRTCVTGPTPSKRAQPNARHAWSASSPKLRSHRVSAVHTAHTALVENLPEYSSDPLPWAAEKAAHWIRRGPDAFGSLRSIST